VTEPVITEEDVASFRDKLDAWVATLGQREQAIVAMIAVRAFPESVGAEVQGYAPGAFEIEDYSFDIEQVLNIGSQSSGGGSGKVSFNPFSVDGTRRGHGFGPGTLDSFVGISLKP
jgi:hypothetical protein